MSGTCPIELSPESAIRQVLRLVAARYNLRLIYNIFWLTFCQKNH
ncbi:hypothetical protein HMPREF0208_05062 [Citrobacter koseri]|nr:hypothetical protein HMPREF3220_04448 [Citrobacter koseri]KXA01838.1 hypothetical protein HMPREF3207_02630 [Citrobacter koseri]KXB38690.1 hypothetical protein HMPREF0208_05062 [Citrobacter koseri]